METLADSPPPLRLQGRAAYEELLESGAAPFSPDIELAFRLHYMRDERTRTRAGLAIASALFLGYAVWDAISFPPGLYQWTIPLRLALLPLFAVTVGASYFRERLRLMDGLRGASVVAAGLCVSAITVGAGSHGIDVGREGIVLIILAGYTVTGLLCRHAAVAGLALPIFHVAAACGSGSRKV